MSTLHHMIIAVFSCCVFCAHYVVLVAICCDNVALELIRTERLDTWHMITMMKASAWTIIIIIILLFILLLLIMIMIILILIFIIIMLILQ